MSLKCILHNTMNRIKEGKVFREGFILTYSEVSGKINQGTTVKHILLQSQLSSRALGLMG